MKYVTIYYGNNKMELHNSILGKETIKVNNEIVSSKYSIFGAEHNFNILDSGKNVECKLTTGISLGGIKVDMTVDHHPLIVHNKNTWQILVVFFIVIGLMVLLDQLKK